MRKPIEFFQHPVNFPNPSVFRGVVRHVVDGDTLDVLVDLGFQTYQYLTIRLRNIDTPEIVGSRRAEGLAAKRAVENLALNRPVRLTVYQDRVSFGRYVADVAVLVNAVEFDLATALRTQGFDQLAP